MDIVEVYIAGIILIEDIMQNSVGKVETKILKYEGKIKLNSGVEFGPIDIAYETYGKLNENADNAILVLHALTGDAHAAGYYNENDKKRGWWDEMIGPKKAFDTDKYFVISSNNSYLLNWLVYN